jgi:short-subunit dehydrogenase
MKNNSTGKGKYALVTGATSGIGFELAKLLANDGYNLILIARSDKRLTEVSNEFRQKGIEVLTLEKDLFLPDAAKEVYQFVKEKGLTVDVLVNDAGQGEKGRFCEVPIHRHLDLIQLNVTSLVALTHLFLGDMIARKTGKILNLASVVSKTPFPEFAIYAASKAFVLSFSEALANELQDTGVTVTALLPGRTDTDFFYKAHMTDTKEYQDHELADPAEVARDGYEALMSGEARVISGAQNKMMVGMMNVMTDNASAASMKKNLADSDKPQAERKSSPGHVPSREERSTIHKSDGDRNDGITEGPRH